MIRDLLDLRAALRNQRIPRHELEALGDRRLQAVIRNTYEHVPYYRSLFRSAGLEPEDIRTVEDLQNVPVTTKNALRAEGIERILADWADRSSLIKSQTSGTTGQPFTVYRTLSEAGILARVTRASHMSMGFGPRDKLVTLGSPREVRRSLLNWLGLYQYSVVSYLAPVEEQVRQLDQLQATIIHSSPSALKALIHNAKYPVKGLINPRLIIVGGEVCDDTAKNELRANFGSDVLNLYGAIELGRMAWECPSHEGLHLNSDHFVFECVNKDRSVDPATEGIATVTSLVAFAMPLIRYQLGDICRFLPQPCSCGRSLPLMAPPLGRQDEMVKLPSGRIASPLVFGTVTNGFPEISRWQVIQESQSHFMVRLVFDETPDEARLEEIRARILEYLAEPVRVDVQLVKSLGDGSLKFRTFVSKVARSDS